MIVVDDTDEDSILDNTDPSALEGDGIVVSEEDTTQTVQEQSEQETENEFGIPEATDDGTITIDDPVFTTDETEAEETLPAESETQQNDDALILDNITDAFETEAAQETDPAALEMEAQETELAALETEAQETELFEEPVVVAEENLQGEDRALYDEVKADLDLAFGSTTVNSEDGTSQVYLTETAAQVLPKKVEQYLMKVLTLGVDAVEMEEAVDPTISQTIIADTEAQAPDQSYEDEEMVQLDKYVRRLIFKDSENFLADSYLEDADKVILYDRIMGVLEDAYKVEDTGDEQEAADAESLEEPDAADGTELDFDEGNAEDPGAEVFDEFADFEEEMGNF